VRVNRPLAKTLLALSYPLRLAAHLSQPAPRRRRARVIVVRHDAD
jgi:hypothetical protein